MIRIIADSSTMYSPLDAKEKGFDVAPLTVTINGESYRELDEISGEEFVQKVRDGHMPKSSQPSVGEVLALYDQYRDDEILNISMADGLSGTYSSAVAAAQQSRNTKGITVLNTRTLCGPHRYLAEVASKLAAIGWTKEKIIERLEEMMKNCKSFLLPNDFDFLRRGKGAHRCAKGIVMPVTHGAVLRFRDFCWIQYTLPPEKCQICKKYWKAAINDVIILYYNDSPRKGAFL